MKGHWNNCYYKFQANWWVSQHPASIHNLLYISGQVNAWTFLPSSYAIEVYDENDIVNAVKFARDFNIRLVVKGTGMS